MQQSQVDRVTPDPSPVRRWRFTVLATAALGAQAPAAGAPADRWTQFRGSAALVGTTAATLPDKLRVLWTYEAGEAVESSAAIADGVVYVGAQPGVLHAIGLADGKPRWKYTASDIGIGESSPAIAGGIVYIGDLSGVLHAVDAASGKAAVDVQDAERDQVLAGRRRRPRADRLLRFEPVRPWGQRRQAALEEADGGLRAWHAIRRRRHRLHRRLRRDPAGDPHQRRHGGLRHLVGRVYRRVTRHRRWPGVLRHL